MKATALIGLGLAMSVVLATAQAPVADSKPAPKPDENKTATKEEKKTVNQKEVAVIKTSEGTMVVELWPDVTPKTVANVKKLANEGFYDGTAFHRVIKDFMIQGGDPLTKDEANKARWGTGDPGYKLKAEFNERSHTRGVISMARARSGFRRLPVLHLPRQPDVSGPAIHGVRQAHQG